MRTKSFDPDGATKRALEAFWQNGYEATNLPELLTTMNVGRASFYNAFGRSTSCSFKRSISISKRSESISSR